MQTYKEINSEQHFIWVGKDNVQNEYLVDAYCKVTGGIKHLLHRYRSYKLERIKSDLDQFGYFSKRPFKLGRGCDGSGDSCVHALYYDFCIKHNLDPVALYRQAYLEHDGQYYSAPDYQKILERANWEGVEYPRIWGRNQMGKLINSLKAINNRSLVRVLESTLL